MGKSVVFTTFILFGGVIGLKIYGFQFVVLFSCILFSLMIIDMITGFAVARKEKRVESRRFIDGFIKKMIIWAVIMIICLVSWNMNYHFGGETIYIGLVPLFIIFIFVIGELLSLLENWMKLSGGNRYEAKIIRTLHSIIGFGFHKGLDIAEKKAKEKVDNFIDNKLNYEKKTNNTSHNPTK